MLPTRSASSRQPRNARREIFVVARAEITRAFVSAAVARKKCPPTDGKKGKDKNLSYINNLTGWGARIRTWEWRNQNPLPYHLATPHPSRRGDGAGA
jgi:hypothetical protein